MSIRAKIGLGYAAALVAVLSVVWTFWWSARRVSESQRAVSHTLEVINVLDQIMGAVLDAQAAVRGYVISGDESDLSPARDAEPQTEALFARLRALVSDSPAQLARLKGLQQAVRIRFAEGERLAELRRTEGFQVAAAQVRSGSGRMRMAAVRQAEATMDASESTLLTERTRRAQNALTNGMRTSALTALAAICVLLAANGLTRRSITGPIAKLEAAANRIGAGDLGFRIRPQGRDELARLGEHFDDMAERRQVAEQNTERARSLLDAVVGSSPLAMIGADIEGRVRTWNAAAEHMFGWRRDQIVGQSILQLVPEADRGQAEQNRRVVLQGSVLTLDARWQRRSGELFDARIFMGPLLEGAAISGVIEVVEDVTARRLAEAERARLLASQRELTVLLEAIIRASMRVTEITVENPGDLRSVLQGVSDEARNVTGADYAALGIKVDDEQPFSPWVVSGVDPSLRERLGRAPRPVGTLGLFTDGSSIRVADVTLHPAFQGFPLGHPAMGPFLGVPILSRGKKVGNLYLANRAGGPLFTEAQQRALELLAAAAGLLIENTRLHASLEQERARMAYLAEVGARFSRTLELEATLQNVCEAAVPKLGEASMIHVLQDDGAIQRAGTHSNDARTRGLLDEIRRRFPLRTDDQVSVIARTIRTGESHVLAKIPPNLPEDYAQNPEHLALVRALNFRSLMAVPLRWHAGTLGALSFYSTTPDRYGDDELELAEDLGARASLAVQNARLYRTAVSATRAREHVVAVVSHDLKNPLNAVKLTASALEAKAPDTPYGEWVRQHAGIVLRGVRRMERLISGLLDAAKLESGALQLNLGAVAPAELVQTAVEEVQPNANHREVSLEVSMPSLPPVLCDRDRVLQVFSNLLGNAVKFTPVGGRISVRGEALNGFVEFEISDTGPGLSREALAHIFERFWQAPGAPPGGTGLGLFICREIVNAHGGEIRGESEPGHGARFIFTLPVAPGGEEQAPAPLG